MSKADTIVWGIAIIAIGISFISSGGLIVGIAIAVLIIGGRYGLPFASEVYTARQSGVSSAKVRQKARNFGSDRGDEK